MLTYPQWNLNRQIAFGVIGILAVVAIIAAIVWWQQSDAKKRAAEVQ